MLKIALDFCEMFVFTTSVRALTEIADGCIITLCFLKLTFKHTTNCKCFFKSIPVIF